MLCTICGEIIRPIVAIDIDGTLGDYHGHFISFAAQYIPDHFILEREVADPYNGEIPFWAWMGITKEHYRSIKLAYRQGGMKRSMPIFDGAIELMKMLKESCAEVWITTTRPYMRLDNIDPDTQAWMERHRITYDFMLYDENKYGQLADRVDPLRVIAILDDDPEQLELASKSFKPDTAIRIDRPHNIHYKQSPVAPTLMGAQTIIRERIEAWIEDH